MLVLGRGGMNWRNIKHSHILKMRVFLEDEDVDGTMCDITTLPVSAVMYTW